MHKPHEIFPSLRRTFVYSGIFQYMDECIEEALEKGDEKSLERLNKALDSFLK